MESKIFYFIYKIIAGNCWLITDYKGLTAELNPCLF